MQDIFAPQTKHNQATKENPNGKGTENIDATFKHTQVSKPDQQQMSTASETFLFIEQNANP